MLSFAASLRFLGGYTIGFWGVKFFSVKFKEKQDAYAVGNLIIQSVCGISSVYTGGWIQDKYSQKFPKTKGLICTISPLISTVFIILAFSVSNNFYFSIITFGLSFYFAEAWYCPCVSHFPNLFPSQINGVAISIF